MSRAISVKLPSGKRTKISADKINFLIGNDKETVIGVYNKEPLRVEQPPDKLKGRFEKIRPGMKRHKSGPWIYNENDIEFIGVLVTGEIIDGTTREREEDLWHVEYPDGTEKFFVLKNADIGEYKAYRISMDAPPDTKVHEAS